MPSSLSWKAYCFQNILTWSKWKPSLGRSSWRTCCWPALSFSRVSLIEIICALVATWGAFGGSGAGSIGFCSAIGVVLPLFDLRRDCFGNGRISMRSVRPFFFLALAWVSRAAWAQPQWGVFGFWMLCSRRRFSIRLGDPEAGEWHLCQWLAA